MTASPHDKNSQAEMASTADIAGPIHAESESTNTPQTDSLSFPSVETFFPATSRLPPGFQVPGYELLSELGHGAMGIVFQARQTALKRLVALKMIRDGALASRQDVIRFRREAEAMARLQHPNIIQVYDIGEYHGLLYCALEFMEGGSLDRLRPSWPLPPEEAARLVETLAQAMHHAHAKGVVHRDLKPGNILLGQQPDAAGQNLAGWSFKISDFGLAKHLDQDSMSLTNSGALLGTPCYMAPEQAHGWSKEIGPAADIYALGVILYELLTGKVPFKGPTIFATLDMVRAQAPPPMPGVPRTLERICLKCLAKEPGQRYPTAADLALELRRFLDKTPAQTEDAATSAEDSSRPHIPGYEILRECGFNGFCDSYQARQKGVNRPVKLKVFAPDPKQPEKLGRMLAATRAVANVPHPHLLTIHDCGELPTGVYVAEEWVDGGYLEHYLGDQPLPYARAVQILESLARAVHHLHRHGIIHRVIGPRSVLMTAQGEPKLGTVYIAKLLGQPTHAGEEEGSLTGYLPWMAPEQAQGQVQEIGPATDVYALGNLLYLMLTAHWPIAYDPGNVMSFIYKLGHEEPVPPSRYFADIPPCLEALCLLCLRKSPQERLASAELLADELSRFREGAAPLHPALAAAPRAAVVIPQEKSQLVRQLLGHQGIVRAVHFGRSGLLWSCGQDGTIRAWETATGKEERRLEGHSASVNGIGLAPDNSLLLSGSDDGTVRLWDVGSGKEFRRLQSQGQPVLAVAYGNTGRVVLSGGEDSLVHLWDVPTGQQVVCFCGHTAAVTCLAISRHDRHPRSGSRDGSTRIWERDTGREMAHGGNRHRMPEVGQILSVACSPNGKYEATGGSHGLICIWNIMTWQAPWLLTGHTQAVTSVAFTPDGDHLLSGSADGTLRLWQVAERRELFCLEALAEGISCVAVAADGCHIATGGKEEIRLWRLSHSP